MQALVNCCHGVLDANAVRWMCSTSTPYQVDEEIIGEEAPRYKPHLHGGPDGAGPSQLPQWQPSTAGRSGRPQPASAGPAPEDDKETAKQRLQRLIRDFANDAVGLGLEVEAHSEALAAGAGLEGGAGALLRMDRRLSRLELWLASAEDVLLEGGTPALTVPLQQVSSVIKGWRSDTAEQPASPREDPTLTIVQRGGHDLRLVFDSVSSRDRAYTCLRIFQMSVDQSVEVQKDETEAEAAPDADSDLTATE